MLMEETVSIVQEVDMKRKQDRKRLDYGSTYEAQNPTDQTMYAADGGKEKAAVLPHWT